MAGMHPAEVSELYLDAQLLCEFFVTVPSRSFGDSRDICDLSLRPALVAQDGRDVNRCRGNAGRAASGCELLLGGILEYLCGLALDLSAELELGAEPLNVVLRL